MTSQKSRSAEKIRLRSYKLAIEAPKIHLDELISPSTTLNHCFTSDAPPPPPPKQNGSSPTSRTLSPQPWYPSHHETPSRLGPSHERNRQTMSSSPTLSDDDISTLSPGALSNGNTPTAESGNPWSSAVGRATTGGKSGRVIERLMNENDRHLREKKLAIVKLEEEVKRGESARSALESLQVSNQNLISMHDSDATLLGKRDRRIQQLRDDLQVEKSRREKAEMETRETRRERDFTMERLRREAVEAREHYSRATSQYDVLSKSWKSLENRYLRQFEFLKCELDGFKAAIETDRQKLSRMEVVTEQMAREVERSEKAKEKISTDFESYKVEQEASVRVMREHAQHNDAKNEEARQQMMAALGQMKYVVNVRRDVKGTP